MSFASDIKENLCRIDDDKKCCKLSQLVAMVCFLGKYDGNRLKIKTENEAVALCLSELLSGYIKSDEFLYSAPNNQSSMHSIVINDKNTITSLANAFILDISKKTLLPNKSLYEKECCKTAFLRGAFLGSGSVSDPSKNYHAEFVTSSAPLADMLYELLLSEQIGAKITVRKNNFVVYIKDSEAIASLLGFMGAGMSMMEFYNIKIEREVRNNVNRQVNCDNANLDKITLAAQKQIAAIRKIENTIGFDTLAPTLKEIAALRIENPEMSLKELGFLLTPPISKSGVNHRLDKICEIADKI